MNKSILGVLSALVMASAVAPAMAETVEFTVLNDSSVDLHYFYTTPSSDEAWGEDLLADLGILEAGYQATATIGDGSDECLYDFKFLGENNEELIVTEIDICSLDSYTLTD
jgi:hypothetical protein